MSRGVIATTDKVAREVLTPALVSAGNAALRTDPPAPPRSLAGVRIERPAQDGASEIDRSIGRVATGRCSLARHQRSLLSRVSLHRTPARIKSHHGERHPRGGHRRELRADRRRDRGVRQLARHDGAGGRRPAVDRAGGPQGAAARALEAVQDGRRRGLLLQLPDGRERLGPSVRRVLPQAVRGREAQAEAREDGGRAQARAEGGPRRVGRGGGGRHLDRAEHAQPAQAARDDRQRTAAGGR